MVEEDLIFAELKATGRLPSPKRIALEVVNLLGQEGTSPEEIASLIQSDPTMSARVLNFANSPLTAPGLPVDTVHEALIRIGTSTARPLILCLGFLDQHPGAECEAFDYRRFWAKSLARAAAMAKLAQRQPVLAPGEAFILGMLARIGQLALVTAWPREYAQCLRTTKGQDLLQLERQQLPLDHVRLTVLLLRDFRLPKVLVDAIAHEHLGGSEDPQVQVIAEQLRLAARLAAWCLEGGAAPEVGFFTMAEESPAAFLEDLKNSYRAWGELWNIPTGFSKPSQSTSVGNQLPGLDILLVDDDPLTLARLRKPLSELGHTVRACRSGQDAWREIRKHPPQLIITDWFMQPMDGLTLCQMVRESNFGRDVYVIMLTANEGEDDLVKAFEVGVDDYVVKPVKLRVLLARLRAGQRIIFLQQELARERAELENKATELARANRELDQLANTDLLTGLPNRRFAQHRLREELAQTMRYSRPLSVMVLDLDHFKSVNDTLGHAVGDAVLKHAAKVIRRSMRACDILCRWGGEEFLAIIPNADLVAASTLAERMRLGLVQHQPKELALQHPLTVSIGVSSCPPQCNLDALISSADQALYRAKELGRNRVEAAS